MKSLKFLSTATLITVASMTTSLVRAHGDEVHAPLAAPHGGQIAVAGTYHLELLVSKDSKEAKDNPVVVFVTDQAGGKVASTGASGTATILSGKTKSTATLTADGENRLKGSASYASTPDMKVIVSVTVPGKEAVQARFTPLAAPMADHSGHKM